MYTIYPIDAGAAFVTPATPAFSHHYDTGFTKTFVGRYLQVSMIQVLSPLWYSFYQKKSCLQIHIHVFLHTRQSQKFIIGHLKKKQIIFHKEQQRGWLVIPNWPFGCGERGLAADPQLHAPLTLLILRSC